MCTNNNQESRTLLNFQRLKYEPGNYNQEIYQSTEILKRTFDPVNVYRPNAGRAEEPGVNSKFGVSYNTNQLLVDQESELKNLTRPLTRRPSAMHMPYCKTCGKHNDSIQNSLKSDHNNGCGSCQKAMYHFPSTSINKDYTRISNPTTNFKEIGINRFQTTYLDFQDPTRWEHPGETNINYRMVVKDNHVPCLPVLIDQRAALPR